MDLVFSFIIAVNQDIVEVDRIEIVELISQGVINIVLERGRAIIQAEGYNKILKESETSFKYGQGFVPLADTQTVKGRINIELSKNLCTAQTIQGL